MEKIAQGCGQETNAAQGKYLMYDITSVLYIP